MRFLQGVEVDGDAERNGDLVGARVPPADGAARVVHLVRHVHLRQVASCAPHQPMAVDENVKEKEPIQAAASSESSFTSSTINYYSIVFLGLVTETLSTSFAEGAFQRIEFPRPWAEYIDEVSNSRNRGE